MLLGVERLAGWCRAGIGDERAECRFMADVSAKLASLDALAGESCTIEIVVENSPVDFVVVLFDESCRLGGKLLVVLVEEVGGVVGVHI